MSSNLTAEPVNRKKLDLGTSLKFALRKRFGEPVNVQLSEDCYAYLQGLMDAGGDDLSEDAQKLMNYIERYGEVRVKEEY